MPKWLCSIGLAIVVAGVIASATVVQAAESSSSTPSASRRSTQTSAPVSPDVGVSEKASLPKVLPAEDIPKPEELKQRAQQRWDALVSKDFATAYEYEAPDYRAKTTLQQFTSTFGHSVRWYLATVKELRYHRADEALVVVGLEYSFPLAGSDEMVRSTTRMTDEWIYVDGQWWRHHKTRPLGVGEGRVESPARQPKGTTLPSHKSSNLIKSDLESSE